MISKLMLLCFFAIFMSCSNKDLGIQSADSKYFVGEWKIAKDLDPDIKSALPTSVNFSEDGKLTLNIHTLDGNDPVYSWAYNKEAKELTLFLSSEESYQITEITKKYFTAKNIATSNLLKFSKI